MLADTRPLNLQPLELMRAFECLRPGKRDGMGRIRNPRVALDEVAWGRRAGARAKAKTCIDTAGFGQTGARWPGQEEARWIMAGFASVFPFNSGRSRGRAPGHVTPSPFRL